MTDINVCLPPQVAFLVDVGLTTFLVKMNYGKPLQFFNPQDLPRFILAMAVRATFAITSIAWSKTGFAITLLRLTDGWTKKFVWFLLVTINIFLGLSALFQWVKCTPIQASWDITVQGTCWTEKTQLGYNLFSGAWSAGADFILALLPWKLLAHLQIQRKEKIGAGIAMSMGIL